MAKGHEKVGRGKPLPTGGGIWGGPGSLSRLLFYILALKFSCFLVRFESYFNVADTVKTSARRPIMSSNVSLNTN